MPTPPPIFRAVSEGRRERETLKYDPSLIAQAVHNDLDNLIPPSELRASPDPALTAFAELAVLRLKTARSLISLFDRDNQYIVAEATPSLSLAPLAKPVDHEAGEHLVLCGTAIPRTAGICELALGVPQPRSARNSLADHELPMTVIPDLAIDPRSSQRAFCHQAPENRFYAGVPLRTPKGIDIGVLCVFDPHPRADLDDISVCFLRDLSRVIVEHLDSKRQRQNQRRADRMVRGVGNFVEGKSTISEPKPTSSPDVSRDGLPQEDDVDGLQRRVERELNLQSPDIASGTPSSCSQTGAGSRDDQSPSLTLPLQRPGPSPTPYPTSSGASTMTARSMSSFARTHPQEPRIRQIFSKAANVVREAIDVKSALFLDASIRSFGGLAQSASQDGGSIGGIESSSSSSESELDFQPSRVSAGGRVGGRDRTKPSCRILGYSSSSASTIDGDPPPFVSVSERFLTKLLRRYPKGKIFNFDARGQSQPGDYSGDEVFSSLAAVEPEQYSMTTPEQPRDTESPARRRRLERLSRSDEERTVAALFPNSRSVVLVPLWDTQRQCWYAGGFVCTAAGGRTMTVEHDLSYLRVFGIVMMSEVDRLRTQLIEQSKTDLLSSLSHELRSPLHGIILGAELLNDTPLDTFQSDMLVSIESCGRTLLETMDHLLDWSKINNFIDPSQRLSDIEDNAAAVPSGRMHLAKGDMGNHIAKLGIEAGMMSISSNFELDVLAEEVVESVCAGFSYQRLSIAQLAKEQATECAEAKDAIRRLDSIQAMEDIGPRARKYEDLQALVAGVTVTFDINPAISWTFHAQPGAIRRIIMNLLGNSLKFTTSGVVNVNVLQIPYERKKGNPSAFTTVKIVVTDTGRGMSQNYIHNHLFTPFSQEDSLTAGLGLGLSLVKQIVAQMGGSIQVLSKPGCGTRVTVVLQLQEAAAPSPTGNPNLASFDEFTALTTQLNGLRVHLLGLPKEYSVDGGEQPELLKGTRSEDALVANFCAEWLRMQIVEPSDSGQPLADLILTTEASIEDVLVEHRHGRMSAPVVVMCRNALAARHLATSARFCDENTVFEFVSQPTGPRKLTKAFLLSLRRWVKLQAAGISITTPSSLATAEPTPNELAPDAGIQLTSEVGYFCKHISKLPGPAVSEDHIVQERQQHEAPDQGNVQFVSKDSGGSSDPPKDESTPTLMPSTSTTMGQEPKHSGPRFLLVDDNPINVRILMSYIKKLGHRFACATNGLEAFEAFERSAGCGAEEFQFVLMDISMPVMDGFESTRRIRALEADRGLPRCNVFALTGLASAGAQQEAFASGIDLFLSKPVRLKELSKILESKGVS